jgi:uncharacterized membrane protein YdbT with pleckstrin-like domain
MATTCPACGKRNEDADPKFCSGCGGPMGTSTGGAPASEERVIFEGHPAAIRGLGALLITVLTLGFAWIYYYLRARGTHYRLTSRRVVIESGIFSKRLEQIDLYRVVDYVVERPFGQRLLGTGNVVIEATDRTQHEVRIDGVRTDVRELYEKLRAATEADKRARGVRVVDVDQHPLG